jgi:hypothetical protein
LAIHELIVKALKNEVQLDLNDFFADDGTLAGDVDEVCKGFVITEERGIECGYKVNRAKTVAFFPYSLTGNAVPYDPLPKEIKRVTNGIVSLGTPLGTMQFVCDYLNSKVDSTARLLEMISKIPHVQTEYQLILQTVAFSRLISRFRTTPPSAEVLEIARRFDSLVRERFVDMIGAPSPLSEFQRGIMDLSTKLGGLGLRSVEKHAAAAFVASFTTCREMQVEWKLPRLQDNRDFSSAVQLLKQTLSAQVEIDENQAYAQYTLSQMIDMESQRRLLLIAPSPQSRAFFIACSGDKAGAWIRQLPTSRDTTFTNSEMIVLFRQQMHVDIAPERLCAACHKKPMDSRGYHALACMRGSSKISNHNKVVEKISGYLHLAQMPHRQEVHGLAIGEHSQERPADILLVREGVQVAYDVTIVSPVAAHSIDGTLRGDPLFAAKQAAEAKLEKYAESHPDLQVIPLAFTSVGGFTKQVIELLRTIAKRCRLHFQMVDSHIQGMLVKEVNVLIKRGIANSILMRSGLGNHRLD